MDGLLICESIFFQAAADGQSLLVFSKDVVTNFFIVSKQSGHWMLTMLSRKQVLRIVLSVLAFSSLNRNPLKAEDNAEINGRAVADAELIWKITVPAGSVDLSGNSGLLGDGFQQNSLGGFSAIEYSGRDQLYWLLPDRGPLDGATDYLCRIHQVELQTTDHSSVGLRVVATQMLRQKSGDALCGSLELVTSSSSTRSRAYDPEAIRVAADGSLLISDEYGPWIDRFSGQGVMEATWSLPLELRLTDSQDLATATVGAVPNRGLEGLALVPGGKEMVVAYQSALVQDSQSKGKKRLGDYARLLLLDAIKPGQPIKQWAYPMQDASFGISEILSVDEHRFLVLERDSETGAESECKALYLIDCASATDISSVHSLPAKGPLPSGIQPVTKKLILD
ncbi:MAG TPA: hypothetical protein DCF63_01705 [Planctomycetaceae bacterium]|nr:hypothetical protein [Planctomycetaceae bacterium]